MGERFKAFNVLKYISEVIFSSLVSQMVNGSPTQVVIFRQCTAQRVFDYLLDRNHTIVYLSELNKLCSFTGSNVSCIVYRIFIRQSTFWSVLKVFVNKVPSTWATECFVLMGRVKVMQITRVSM